MRGNAPQVKCHYQGADDDYVIYVDSKEAVQQWNKDSSVPLAHVVSRFKIFVSHKHGNQGVLDEASKAQLESEFGTSTDEEVMKQMLEKGTIIESSSPGRDGNKNDSKGTMVAH